MTETPPDPRPCSNPDLACDGKMIYTTAHWRGADAYFDWLEGDGGDEPPEVPRPYWGPAWLCEKCGYIEVIND